MKILALELSTARGSLAWDDGETLEQEWPNDRKNSGPFFASLQGVMAKHGSPDMIVVGLGPGSYAGVRIAISAAIGLQAVCGARLVGLPSICAMECESSHYDVIGDARRQAFFLARIEHGSLLQEPRLWSEAELRTELEAHAALPVFSSDALPQFSRVRSAFPSAARLARLARDSNRCFSLPPLQPMYLREPHITMPRKNLHSITPS
jgi:tRNA threonylcarbamoyladenosine biosynthesis protein TsaB